MSEDLKQRIKEFNKIKYPQDNETRIIIAKLKFFISSPCNVTKIFQIETKENKNIEDINA